MAAVRDFVVTAAYSMADFQTTSVTDSWNDTATQHSNRGALPSNCLLTSSSDGSDDLVSPETALLITKIKSAVFVPLLFVFGAPTNILNMAVFVKQGLCDRVNLCLFSLSALDFLTVSFFFLLFSEQIFMFSSHEMYGPVFTFITNNKITIFYSCTYASMFLNAVIALERCFCVLFPLHARTLLKTKTMAIILGIGVPVISFLRLLVMAKYAVVCFFDSRTEKTYLSMYVTDFESRNKAILYFLDVIFYGFIIAVGCPILVLITTLITSVKLWQTVAWRKQTSSADARKEMAVTKMLILLSIEFLIFSLPLVFLRLHPLQNPDFSPRGKYRLYFLAWVNAADVSLETGLTLNFFIYYFASSKYRCHLQSLFKKNCGSGNFSKRQISSKLSNSTSSMSRKGF